MENNILFTTGKLKNTIKEMSTRFLLVEEFPFEERGEELRVAVGKAMGISESDLGRYTFSLGGREIENVIFALFEHSEANKDSKKTKRLLEILAFRMSERLLEIIWQLYQFKYKDDNSNLALILKISFDYCEKNELKTAEAEMLEIFYKDKGKDKIVEMLNGQSLPINSFASLYKINAKSPMLKSIAKKYLEQCEKSVYAFNEAWMNRIIAEVSYSKLEKLIINYLSSFSEEEYIDSINMSILEKIGYPYASSDWVNISDDLKRKFSNWNALRLMEEHFKNKTNIKYVLLSKYINYTKKVMTLKEEQLLIVDFDKFVIADDASIAYCSYLIEKNYFEKIRGELEVKMISSFVKDNELLLEARDYIIEETESNVFQLDYRDVGKLYIKKTLDIMLGLIMDTRPSKSIAKAADLYFEYEFR